MSKKGTQQAPGERHRVVWPLLSSHWIAQSLALQFQFERSQWWPPERLQAHQLAQATRLIRHATKTVPFYGEQLISYAASLEDGLTIESFRELPLLTKVDVQEAGNAMLSQDVPSSHGMLQHLKTSGSTGRPVDITTTELSRTMLWANTLRGHAWHKRDVTAKNMEIRPIAGDEPAGERRWVPFPHGGPSVWVKMGRPIPEIFDRLIEEDPIYMQTHSCIVLDLVERSRQLGVKPGKLREIRCFGEILHPEARAAALSEWGVPVHDNYSASETGTMAIQCPDTETLHVAAETVLLEVVDDAGQPCGPGERGQIVVTTLLNYAMPLIRYAIADYAVVGDVCSCGRGLPVLERVIGRDRNMLVLPSGERRALAGGVTRIADHAPIRQFQYVQTALDHIKVNLVVARALTAEEETAIMTTLADIVGAEFTFSLSYLDDIPRAPNGKFEIVRCDVEPADRV